MKNPIIIDLPTIKSLMNIDDLVSSQEKGFVSYSKKLAQVPLPGHLHFEEPVGDCHIKFGYIKGDSYFVVKVATGFYKNPALGLPSGDGAMLLLSQDTGHLQAVLLDQGYLTDLRTAIAGRVVAKYLAPPVVHQIGILGTGVQAKMQVELLKGLIPCMKLGVWGRSSEKALKYKEHMENIGYEVTIEPNVEALCASSNLIVTTTASREALIEGAFLKPGTHVTALGADGVGKQELAKSVFSTANRCFVDSVLQCSDHGDSHYALKEGTISISNLIELGELISNPTQCSRKNEEITVADLTGLAVQDIQIATWFYNKLSPCLQEA